VSRPTTERRWFRRRPPRPFRRTRFIVDPRFQYNVIVRVVAQSVLTLALVSLCLFGPMLVDLLGEAHSQTRSDSAVVMLYMHAHWWWIAALSLLFATASALRMSHRIAGPLVRFNRNLRWLGEGRFAEPLRTRPGDYLKPEVEMLNAAVSGVRQRTEAAQAAHTEARTQLRDLVAAIDAADDAKLKDALRAMETALEQVGDRLGSFQVATETDEIESAAAATVPAPA